MSDEVKSLRSWALTAEGIGGPLQEAFDRGFKNGSPLVQFLVNRGAYIGSDQIAATVTSVESGLEEVVSLPLPITSVDVIKGADEDLMEIQGSRVGWLVERTALGIGEAFTVHDVGCVYGLMNHPERTTFMINPNAALGVKGAVDYLRGRGFTGPYLVISGEWYENLGAEVSAEEFIHLPVPEMNAIKDIVVLDLGTTTMKIVQSIPPKVVMKPDWSYLAMTVTVPKMQIVTIGLGVVHMWPEN